MIGERACTVDDLRSEAEMYKRQLVEASAQAVSGPTSPTFRTCFCRFVDGDCYTNKRAVSPIFEESVQQSNYYHASRVPLNPFRCAARTHRAPAARLFRMADAVIITIVTIVMFLFLSIVFFYQ